VVLKFLFHIHFSLFGWGFYADVIVAAALVYFAAQARVAAPAGMSTPSRPAAPPPPPAPTGTPGAPEGTESTPPPGP
jgi:hypothetical protein